MAKPTIAAEMRSSSIKKIFILANRGLVYLKFINILNTQLIRTQMVSLRNERGQAYLFVSNRRTKDSPELSRKTAKELSLTMHGCRQISPSHMRDFQTLTGPPLR